LNVNDKISLEQFDLADRSTIHELISRERVSGAHVADWTRSAMKWRIVGLKGNLGNGGDIVVYADL
jgi:hypothetical protein